MYDPDAGHHRPLRLGAPAIRPAVSPAEILASAEREMEAAIARWSSAYVDWTASRAQARPIAASAPDLSSDNDFWTHRHCCETLAAGRDALIMRADGSVENLRRYRGWDKPKTDLTGSLDAPL